MRSCFAATAEPGISAIHARFSDPTAKWSRSTISTRPKTRNAISGPRSGTRAPKRKARNNMRALTTALLSLGMIHAQDHPMGPIEVERLNGPVLQISNYAEHAATVVLFLSTRCEKTSAAAAAIRRLNDMNRRRRVMFAGVFSNPAESVEEVRAFCQGSGFVFPCYRDPGRKAAKQLGATVTPEAFVIDKDARLRYRGSIGAL